MTSNRWQFKVEGFAGLRHSGGVPFGSILVSTVHADEAGAYLEIEAWKSRMKRTPAEVDHACLVDLRPGGTLTNLHILPSTYIPWSHLRATKK